MARRFIIREFWSMAQFKPRQEGFELNNPMLLFWAFSGSALIGIELLISTNKRCAIRKSMCITIHQVYSPTCSLLPYHREIIKKGTK